MKYLKNKAQTLMLILTILCVQNLMGQRGRHHQPNMITIEAVKEDLNLSEEQTARIEKIQTDFKAQIQLVRADETKGRSEKRATIRLLTDNQKTAIEQVLTESQQTLLAERKAAYKEERKAKMEERKSSRKELKTTLETYRTKNIEPVILAQRAKLETALSQADKAELAELRIAFADKKVAKKEEIEKRKAARKANKEKRGPADRKAKIEARKAQQVARENDEAVIALKALVDKYENNIEELYAEIEPQQTTWKAEQKKIIQQFKQEKGAIEPKGPRSTEGYKRRGGEKAHRRGNGKRHGHHRDVDNRMRKGHFLLLEPNQIASTNLVVASTQIKVYPNPATSNNTLDYEVRETGRIKIELHDEQGRLVKILLDEEKAVGKYQLNTDLSELKNRTYFYVVSDKQGITTKKFLILEK